VSGLNYGNAHPSTDIATNLGVQCLPLLGKEGQNLLQQGIGFFSKKAIVGDYK
jgi:hypothetical protein